MERKFFILIILLALFFSGCYAKNENIPEINIYNIMKLTSPDFSHDGDLPMNLTCDGAGRPPVLEISEMPAEAVSLALIVSDPDAPRGTFIHWAVWNMDPKVSVIRQDNLMTGAVVGVNSGGVADYFPPCPPTGEHCYMFKLYALDRALDLGPEAGGADLVKAMEGHILAEAVLVGKYGRS